MHPHGLTFIIGLAKPFWEKEGTNNQTILVTTNSRIRNFENQFILF